MLSMRMKSVVALSALVLTSSSLADSPVFLKAKAATTVQSTANESGFVYPTPTLIESDFIETGVLFLYNEHILDYFNGDSEKLLNFVNANIAHNNQAFVNSNIPIRRVVTGLVRIESDEIWSSNDTYTDRLHALASWQRSNIGQQYKQQNKYSYLVSLAGYQKSATETTMLGQAFVGDNVSWIAPFNTNENAWIDRTLAHELSHNDGFKHASSDYKDGGVHVARYDAAGYQCGAHGSIMYISGLRTEPFFSDADIHLEENNQNVNCGTVGEANAAQVYRDLLRTTFANSEGTFKNIQAPRLKTGVVSIHENVSVAIEGYNIEFDIIFEGADKGDSVNFIARQGTANLDDFESTIGSVTHNGVNNVYTISMPIYTDNVDEALEHFSYELVYANGVTIDAENASIQASIFDKNDDVGYVEFSNASLSVIEGDTAEITINRMGGSEGLITYTVETFVGSANQDDFESTSQEITFNNGETSKTLLIRTMADSLVEQDESFTVKITQILHPLYALNAKTMKEEIKVTINNPVAAINTTNNSTPASTNPPAATSNTNQAGGGSLSFICAFILLLVAVGRHARR